MSALHTLHDGSCLKIINAKELITIPVWKGNRIIDLEHMRKIKTSIGTNIKHLDHGYILVTCPVTHADGHSTIHETYLIDGQHRHAVLKDYFKESLFEDDFPIVVIEKRLESEFDIIDYFNTINSAKPLQWEIDPNLIINEYIGALEKAFNVGKKVLIKKGNTYRPYLPVEKLRDALFVRVKDLKPGTANVSTFIAKVQEWNAAKVARADIDSLGVSKKEGDFITRAAELHFMLSLDRRFKWIDACLK